MNILIGCEFSGVVRDAFIRKGHNAISCDLLPTQNPGPHIQGDIFKAINSRQWDMAIFFPPCTYLCSSGLHWNKRRPERQLLTDQAVAFVWALAQSPIKKIAIENPIGCLSTKIRKPDQIIQPWQFGHAESKATCLWLKGLPLLKPTKILSLPEYGYWENQTPSRQNKIGPSPLRWALRSITYPGIALAMSQQWKGR